MPPRKPTAKQVHAYWLAGFLAYKLDSNQIKTYREIRTRLKKPFARYVLNWARRTGKTSILLLIAVEESIRHKRSRWNVAASTKESLREFIWPIIDWIFEDCPEALKPRMSEQRGRITWPSKSVIVLASCHDKRTVERLRGPKASGNIIEEAGTIPDEPGLRYLMTAILNPQLLTTLGATLMALTPPRSAGHEAVGYALTAKANGNYSHATLYDNPRLTPENIAFYLQADADALGMTVEEYKDSPDYKREWLAEFITDPTRAVLPGFSATAEAEIVRPLAAQVLFADRYESMDLGWSPDFTGILFGYWDYERQALVIQHEFLIRRMSPMELGMEVAAIERRLWGHHEPYLRVADMPAPLFHDFATAYSLRFVATEKDDRDAAIAATDVWIRQRKIQVVPYDAETGLGCKHLPVQMRLATHNKHRTDFDRTAEHGHFDLVAALVYLVRNVRKNMGKVPDGWGLTQDIARTASPKPNSSVAALRMLVGGG